jgi:hypothetical protein
MTKVFVFGSNLAGRHGAGAALFARKHHGAIYGVGEGVQGNSYGIPTKDEHLNVLPLTEINRYVNKFLLFAVSNPQLEFEVTAIGCGLAGYLPRDVAPMFRDAPTNCTLPDSFVAYILSPDANQC